jgi:hypothetical protein
LIDRLAYLLAKGCFKIGCETAPYLGLALGLIVGADEIAYFFASQKNHSKARLIIIQFSCLY